MNRLHDIFLTALAPAIWGSTYLVATETLPAGYPITLAALRALPAGLLLLAWTRILPSGLWLWRSLVLGALNFSVFWVLLYVAAYRLPGGVAATLGSVQALLVILLSRPLLGTPIRAIAVALSLAGVGGVALLVLGPDAALDPWGMLAAVAGAASMAAGTVLTRRWQAPVPALGLAAWQLTAGGLLLLPLAWITEPALPRLDATNIGGLLWLTLAGAAITYWLWFRGLARLEPAAASMLGLASPVTAVILGWAWLGQSLNGVQLAGMAIVLASVVAGQLSHRPRPGGSGAHVAVRPRWPLRRQRPAMLRAPAPVPAVPADRAGS